MTITGRRRRGKGRKYQRTAATFAECIQRNVEQNRTGNVLQDCGSYNLYAQLDGEAAVPPHRVSIFLPQHHHLEELHTVSPHSVWILNVRPADQWAASVSNWFSLSPRFLRRFNLVFSRRYNVTERLMMIYDNHTRVVRNFVRDHPTHRLVEFDITDPEDVRHKMVQTFGLDPTCWGQSNENKRKRGIDRRDGSNATGITPGVSLPE
jgi:hypothetical protein